MKHLLTGLALIIGVSQPVSAGTILPNLFASRYCSLREIGANGNEALAAAVKYATISSNDWIMVNDNGVMRRSDVVESYNAIASLCPRLIHKP